MILSELAEAATILAKYGSSHFDISAEHDEIFLGDAENHPPEKLSHKDIKRLSELGLKWKDDAYWHSYV